MTVRDALARITHIQIPGDAPPVVRSAAEALADLVPGDVIVVPTGRRAGVAVVIDPGLSLGEDPRPFVLTRAATSCRVRHGEMGCRSSQLGKTPHR
jgi:ATP-dependent RNA helicase HelY